MLKRLSIKHYAIIEDAEIQFGSGLNMMTGETGAGKSIILGALSLLLGERADAQAVQQGAAKCIVEVVFQNEQQDVSEFLSKNEFDSLSNEIILRREVYSAGKSRAFINDTPATLQQLSQLTDYLIDIHRQHQTLSLQQRSFQLFVIDTLAGNQQRLMQYRSLFHQWQHTQEHLATLRAQHQRLQAEFDFNQFQFNELMNASLTNNAEQELLEAELKMLENAEELQLKLNEVLQILEQGDVNSLMMIKTAQTQVQSLVKKMPQAESIANRLLELREQMMDVSAEAEELLNKVENNPQRVEEIQERLNTIYNLQKKHRVQDVDALIQIRDELELKLNHVSELDNEISQIEFNCNQYFSKLIDSAKSISLQRNKSIPTFEKQLKQLLKSVGMPSAELKVQSDILEEKDININGLDKIEFLFTANKGFNAQPLQKMASGGELSRLMLCIKSIIAKSAALPTLVFDEIDNGISGETAQQVGLLMKQIAVTHQVICITHLPQMAAKADTHFFIYKEQKQNKTYTRIRILSAEERVVEIAKMLSGEKPGQAALQNAKELIDL